MTIRICGDEVMTFDDVLIIKNGKTRERLRILTENIPSMVVVELWGMLTITFVKQIL